VGVDRPAPDEELNNGEVTAARPAASVIVLRDGDAGLEVLLVQRNPAARFMGGAWVFPGGAVDGDGESPAQAAAREAGEEASVELAAEELVPFSRWITPVEVKIRFDTFFFVAVAPPDVAPEVDGEECVAWRWIAPGDALEAYSRGELQLVFPTIKHLEQLVPMGSVGETITAAQAREIVPVQPRIATSGDAPRVLLPGEEGFDDTA
jgi:8-oxo-dGTP pyrophosphatase MutT (NUDIX family)